MSCIEVVPLSNAIGAEIRGLDLREALSDEAVRVVKQAWYDHVIILFRDQDLTYQQQRAFAENFGTLGRRHGDSGTLAEKAAGEGVMLITNVRENGKPIGTLPDGEMMFHSDTPYNKHPIKATMLYAIDVPSRGGETLFSNCYKAAGALPEDVKHRLAGRQARHIFDYEVRFKPDGGFDPARHPHSTHPVFRKHPETGRSSLFASELMTDTIIGLAEEESRELLDLMFTILRRDEFIHAHAWRPGDLLMWDNRCCNHARNDFPREERRLLRRLTLEDEHPVIMGDPPYSEGRAQ
jgi:taurine dioxygenase